jgi:hypothetical protein
MAAASVLIVVALGVLLLITSVRSGNSEKESHD